MLAYTELPHASCDFNHDPHSAIVDGSLTRASGPRLVNLLAWFDNEWGSPTACSTSPTITCAWLIARSGTRLEHRCFSTLRKTNMTVLKMTDLDLQGKRVLIREDLNVPVKDGAVKSDAHPGLVADHQAGAGKGAAVLVCSHLGRPEEGVYSEEDSLAGR